jgi:threonine aldolase
MAGARPDGKIDWALERHGVNLSSDTQTRPTAGMREAMMRAEVGDEQRRADPTVRRLEERVAELLGKRAAVFLPTGTMCNAIALRLHLRPGGDEVILDRTAHPVRYESAGLAAISGALAFPLDTPHGIFTAHQVRAAIRPLEDPCAPRSRLVSVENTTNVGGGRIWPLDTLDEIVRVARACGLRCHLDGARLFNASVATNVPPARYAAGFDTAWVDFAKGLGAPMGAVLCGSQELIDEAWRYKFMLGGAMRQVGFMAAACEYALDHHIDRLAVDHGHARTLAEGLAEIEGIDVDPASVETNIVRFGVPDARVLCRRLERLGVLAGVLDSRTVRMVTHLDVSAEGIHRALAAVAQAVRDSADRRERSRQ